MWYHVSHSSHAIDLPHLTALLHSPQGYLGVLGPGFSSTCPLSNRLSRMWYEPRFELNLKPCVWCQKAMLRGPISGGVGMKEISMWFENFWSGEIGGGSGGDSRIIHQLTINNSMRVNMVALIVDT